MKNNIKPLYEEWKTLQNRGAINPLPDEGVEGTLLVGTKSVLKFESGHSQCGNDYCSLFPAFHNGERCWVRRDKWEPAQCYSASGTSEYIISFEEGVKLFIEHGVFEFPDAE
jgi:hypothetical protein